MATAVLVGATGLVGKHALEGLATDPHFDRVIVLARRTHEAPLASKIEWRTVDFDSDATYSQLKHDAPDAVLCCLGTTKKQTPDLIVYRKIDHDYPVKLAAATAPKAVFCIISSVGADPKSRSYYLRFKGETERDVAAAGPTTVHVFRPSFLIGDRGGSRLGEELGIIAMTLTKPLLFGGLQAYRSIKGSEVAAAMIRLAKIPTPGTHIHTYKEMVPE